jgi:hypothetical protein
MFLAVTPFLENGGTFGFREPTDYDPEWFSGDVDINGRDGMHSFRAC